MDQFGAVGAEPTLESQLEQCPYVPSHQIRPGHAMQRHLQKCRKNCLQDTRCPWHENAKRMSICQFNSTHHVLNSKMRDHVEKCPDALMVLQIQSQTRVKEEAPPVWFKPVQNESAAPVDDDDENWDDDSAESYDPKQKLAQNPQLITVPYGKTPSERRQFRQEKRFMADGSKKGN